MTPQDFESFPVFSDNGTKVQPDDPKYAAGFAPGDVLPAEWLNWFLNTLSKGYNQLVQHANEGFIKTISTSQTLTPTQEQSVVINTAGVTLTLGSGPYVGYTLPVLATAACSVSYTGSGGATTDSLPAGSAITYTYDGARWLSSASLPQTLKNKTIAYADNTLTGVQPTLTAGTGIDITGTTISAKQTYSTSEVFTGQYWTDGKPIYVITKTGVLCPTAADVEATRSHSIASINDVINYRGMFTTNSPVFIKDSYYLGPSEWFYLAVDRTYIRLKCGGSSGLMNRSGDVTIWYTKTTD